MSSGTRSPSGDSVTPPLLPTGHIVGGRYTIQFPLARHAWASTYGAITAPNREVVIKVVDASSASRSAVPEALRRAGIVTRALGDRYVIPLLDSGRDAQSGASFIVTELSVHPSLEQLVQICPLDPAEAAILIGNLARVLDGAHGAGVTHLALKPSNVFVGPGPEYAVRVADFAAGALRAATEPAQWWSFAAPWLSPEQATKESEEAAGPPADEYAAALIAFFALTGHVFWEPPGLGGRDPVSWGNAIGDLRVPASDRARAFGFPLESAVDVVLARALAANPEERFETVGALADALGRALATRGTHDASARTADVSGLVAPLELVPSAQAVAISIAQVAMPVSPPPPAPDADGLSAEAARHLLSTPGQAIEGEVRAATPSDAAGARLRASDDAERIPGLDSIVPRSPRTRIAWVLGAAGLVALLGVGGLSALRSRTPPLAPTSSASVAAAAPLTASAQEERAPVKIVAPPATTPAPASASDVAELLVVCVPECDRVLLNGKRMKSYPQASAVAAGTYGIGVARPGYGGQFKQLSLRPGQKETVTFTLGRLHAGAEPAKKPPRVP
jgi:serine/threonine protein kinase